MASDTVRDVLRLHAKGVAVITAGDTTPVGFCATSLATVALDPAVVSFSVHIASVSWATISSAGYVAAHLLADDQQDLAQRFARRGAAKFAPPTRWYRGIDGLPMLHDVLASLVLAPLDHLRVADQELVACRVLAATRGRRSGPLVHHAGQYVALPDPESLAV